jgi:tetratricopeptide (TPR) repeat protein
MQKQTSYLLLASLMVIATTGIVLKFRAAKAAESEKIYTLLERVGPDASGAEWASTRSKAASYVSALKADPNDVKANLALAATFIQEARVTGNHAYYDKAAMKHINDVLRIDAQNFSALCYRSLLLLSQHHFSEGLETSKKAQAINPHNAFIYGLLTDAYVELGDYKSAVEMSDKMQSVKPDIRSYARVSYLREIYGDYAGAIEAMKLAVAAGPAGTEGTEWARVQLGLLYELTGALRQADSVYSLSLDYRPGYAYAYSGLARMAIAQHQYDRAAALYGKADSLVTDNSFKEELADLYFFQKRDADAKRILKAVIRQLTDAGTATDDASIGHYNDNELALDYLKTGDLDAAMKHAGLEYNRRPENITVNETMAWVHFLKGETQKALSYIKTAMKTGSRNPALLCHAGLIYYKAGDKAVAKMLLNRALGNGASFNTLLQKEAADVLKSL